MQLAYIPTLKNDIVQIIWSGMMLEEIKLHSSETDVCFGQSKNQSTEWAVIDTKVAFPNTLFY